MDGAPPERESAPVTESGRRVCALRLRWRFPIEPLKSGAVAFVVGTLDLNDDLEHPSAIALGASDQTRKRLQSLLQMGQPSPALSRKSISLDTLCSGLTRETLTRFAERLTSLGFSRNIHIIGGA